MRDHVMVTLLLPTGFARASIDIYNNDELTISFEWSEILTNYKVLFHKLIENGLNILHPKVVSFNRDSVKRHGKERPVTTFNLKLPIKVVSHEIKETPLAHEESGAKVLIIELMALEDTALSKNSLHTFAFQSAT